jgi:hypothetical protein
VELLAFRFLFLDLLLYLWLSGPKSRQDEPESLLGAGKGKKGENALRFGGATYAICFTLFEKS